ncbi:filamentous hemagglutinin N-terminal domain-containing protein [Hydrogenophaga sp.]|uniref:two-partner secretion domain-containing protein n=1 Tax=Hydrogenophaga sp. TaxID=1904254 RepID=UPI002623BCED|nr:filamentous hemagglutinin N-terminal domain-containing protein [Hydrogenophaga sp.]MCW5654799.1 filamentous hemagglutinin N-terminal domain-containing protein [Hydrogenophaga sp.]
MTQSQRTPSKNTQIPLLLLAENALRGAASLSQGERRRQAAQMRRRARQFRQATLGGAVMMAFCGGMAPALAQNLPSGGSVVVGAGTISGGTGADNTLTIQQHSARLGIDWQTFSIGAGHTVQFLQPGASAVALNRVIGNDPSAIFGALKANGQVFLVNPNGVLFGATATVDAAGLVVSTKGISNADFSAGNYRFSGPSRPGATIVNQGNITSTEGGYIALVGDQLVNDSTGRLSAARGKVVLAAGDTIVLTLDSGSLVTVAVDGAVLDALVENKGLSSITNLTQTGNGSITGNLVSAANRGYTGTNITQEAAGTIGLNISNNGLGSSYVLTNLVQNGSGSIALTSTGDGIVVTNLTQDSTGTITLNGTSTRANRSAAAAIRITNGLQTGNGVLNLIANGPTGARGFSATNLTQSGNGTITGTASTGFGISAHSVGTLTQSGNGSIVLTGSSGSTSEVDNAIGITNLTQNGTGSAVLNGRNTGSGFGVVVTNLAQNGNGSVVLNGSSDSANFSVYGIFLTNGLQTGGGVLNLTANASLNARVIGMGTTSRTPSTWR